MLKPLTHKCQKSSPVDFGCYGGALRKGWGQSVDFVSSPSHIFPGRSQLMSGYYRSPRLNIWFGSADLWSHHQTTVWMIRDPYHPTPPLMFHDLLLCVPHPHIPSVHSRRDSKMSQMPFPTWMRLLQSSLSSKFIVSSNYTLLFKNRSHEETEGLNCLIPTSLERDYEKPKLTSKKGTYYRWQQHGQKTRTLVLSSESSRRLWVLGGTHMWQV